MSILDSCMANLSKFHIVFSSMYPYTPQQVCLRSSVNMQRNVRHALDMSRKLNKCHFTGMAL